MGGWEEEGVAAEKGVGWWGSVKLSRGGGGGLGEEVQVHFMVKLVGGGAERMAAIGDLWEGE